MKKLAILKTNNSAEVYGFSGDAVLKDLQLQQDNVQNRLSSLRISMNILNTEEKEWTSFARQAKEQVEAATEPNRKATFVRLENIATKSANQSAEQSKKITKVGLELKDASNRLDELISVLKIEKNLQSVISNLSDYDSVDPLSGYDENIREIKRVLYTADAVLELAQ